MMILAFIDGKFLDRTEREERIKIVKKKLKTLLVVIKSGKATPYHYEMMERDKAELEKLNRVHRAEVDMLYFFYEYFSEARNPGNPDNLVPTSDVDISDAPEFHQKICNILDSISNYNKTANVCWSASRGHAKSAYLSNAFPTRELVFRKRKMILIISETLPGSIKFLKWIANQLKYNLKLRDDFGEILSPDQNKNKKDAVDQFVTFTEAMLACSSLGKQIRGIRNGSQRPDLLLLDDLESIEANNTAELRKKNKNWFNAEMYPARDVTSAATVFMGTMTHPDSLLNYVLTERTDFIRNKFPAIIEFPERMDLWDEFTEIFKKYEPTEDEIEAYETATVAMPSPNERAAMDFYRAHKEEMNAGAKVLWASRFPLHKLFMEKASIGSRAFATEFQNTAIDSETAIFRPEENFHYYNPQDFDFLNGKYQIVFGTDFAMGKSLTKGDYSAVTVLAKHKTSGLVYVADSYLKRVSPDIFMSDIVNLALHWQPDTILAESQMAQEFFTQQLKKALQAAGYPAYTRVKDVHQRSRKEIRIESALKDIEEGTLLFNRNHTLLLKQYEEYGTNSHDDGPDSLSTAMMGFKKSKAKIHVKYDWM
jgi:predicted phage terminase large subunit-like protein